MAETSTPPKTDALALAQQVLVAEADAVRQVPVTPAFAQAVALIADCPGAVVVSGLGKSGLVGQKLSATLASLGSPSHVLHPVEAMHGDVGRVRRGDVVLVLSHSGATDEVVALCDILKQDGIPIVAIVGQAQSPIGKAADAALPLGKITEACPHNLAPTASTAAMMALGDALALAVSIQRGFTAEDFARMHPGGGLGRQLMPVTEAMRFHAGQNLPLITQGTTVQSAYAQAQRLAEGSGLRRAGALLVVDGDGTLAGMVTDGDLRSALIEKGPAAWDGPIDAVMTARPTTLPDSATVRDAVHLVRAKRFDELPVLDGAGKPVGLIDVQDLAALKVIEG